MGYYLWPIFVNRINLAMQNPAEWFRILILEILVTAFTIFLLSPRKYIWNVCHYLHQSIHPVDDPYISHASKAFFDFAYNPSLLSLGNAIGRSLLIIHFLNYRSWSLLLGIWQWATVYLNLIQGFLYTADIFASRSRYLAGIGENGALWQVLHPQAHEHPIVVLLFAQHPQQPPNMMAHPITPLRDIRASHLCQNSRMKQRGS